MLGLSQKRMSQITCVGKSDAGLKRSNNEDAFVVNAELGLCLLADGMGGAAAGELASRIFTEKALYIFSESDIRSEKEALKLAQRAFSSANEGILDHVAEQPHHKGMGCTAELIAFRNGSFVLGHVGDSRTYRLRKEELKLLTQDHSLVQDQVNKGLITLEEARTHSLKNVILRAVGIENSLAVDFIRGKTRPHDLFLLCSDGLTDMIDDTAIQEVLLSVISLSQKVENLIELAKSAGGYDNITVVLAEIV